MVISNEGLHLTNSTNNIANGEINRIIKAYLVINECVIVACNATLVPQIAAKAKLNCG